MNLLDAWFHYSGKGCSVCRLQNGVVRRRSNGFTLIELLVVIAIIGILLAILIPSLTKAKEQVKTVICRSHLKGIGTALLVYFDQNDGRSYDYTRPSGNVGANEFLWYDPANPSVYINPRAYEAYWGVAYVSYTESQDVFGCPSYVMIPSLIYNVDPKLCRQAGYAINANFNNLKVSDIRSASQFIITHDHVEPKIEGQGQGDLFAIETGNTVNLTHYRPTTAGGKGGREQFYKEIFRHNKRNKSLDDPGLAASRVAQIEKSPNGLANCLFLDGHVEPIRETVGKNIFLSWYTGKD